MKRPFDDVLSVECPMAGVHKYTHTSHTHERSDVFNAYTTHNDTVKHRRCAMFIGVYGAIGKKCVRFT